MWFTHRFSHSAFLKLSSSCSLSVLLRLFLGTTIYPRQKCECVYVCVYVYMHLSLPFLFIASLFLDSVSFLILNLCFSLYSNPICPLKGNCCFLLTTHLTPNVWGLFHTKQFSSTPDTNWVSCSLVLTLTTWNQHRPCRLRALSHKAAPTSDISCKFQVVTCISHQPAISQGSHNLLLRLGNLL